MLRNEKFYYDHQRKDEAGKGEDKKGISKDEVELDEEEDMDVDDEEEISEAIEVKGEVSKYIQLLKGFTKLFHESDLTIIGLMDLKQ